MGTSGSMSGDGKRSGVLAAAALILDSTDERGNTSGMEDQLVDSGSEERGLSRLRNWRGLRLLFGESTRPESREAGYRE